MTRAELLREAILDGLERTSKERDPLTQRSIVDIVEQTEFLMDKYGRVFARAPRLRLDPYKPSPLPMVLKLREGIEDGLRVHGFGDPITIEP